MPNNRPYRADRAFFLTFRTYGTWLHGDRRGSNSRIHRTRIAPNDAWNDLMRGNLVAPEIVFTPDERAVLFDAILEFGLCGRYDVFIDAANVRSNHVHVLVTPRRPTTPEQLVNVLKGYLSGIVKTFPRFRDYRSVWARRFSGKVIFNANSWRNIAYYILLRQEGGNAYLQSTRFVRRKGIPIDDDGEPNARALFLAFVNDRVMYFRRNQLARSEEDVEISGEGDEE